MQTSKDCGRRVGTIGGICTLILGTLAIIAAKSCEAHASSLWLFGRHRQATTCPVYVDEDHGVELGGTWYWLRSPDEEKRVIAGLYNRYCIRCHGVDGRGVWDIPDVPDFTNARWQACRSDGQLARLILEGRGAVMPPFRGTLSLEEAWAMARYIRTFMPGTEASRPDYGPTEKPAAVPELSPKAAPK